MSNSSEVELARDIALRKIGRNLFNFQRMEVMLKYLLAFSRLRGPLSQIQEKFAKRVASISKMPMGRLVDGTAESLYGTHEEPNEAVSQITVSVSILLEGGKDQARIWKKEMALVVRERNALVHKMLSHFDPYSLASCETLSAALDEQRARITPAFLQLEALVVAMRELHNGESLQANCLNGLDAHGEA